MEEEAMKYDIVWRDSAAGETFAPFFLDGFRNEMRAGQTLIHFGCGTARVTKTFLSKGLNVTLVDISPYALDEEIRNMLILLSNQVHFVQACLWQLPKQLKDASWIYCCDVLEHMPKECLDSVLGQMGERMRLGGYLSICLKDDERNKGWWEKKLAQYFDLIGEDLVADEDYFNCRIVKKK
ncbi:MAG: class I SAM-dependent methyltransferase [Verrucomicrobia bacterium]|nr:class I SAM-dependent methyltransferase [Verrucomicrobiota bacterium]